MLRKIFQFNARKKSKSEVALRKKSLKKAKRMFMRLIYTGERKRQIPIYTSMLRIFESWLKEKQKSISFSYEVDFLEPQNIAWVYITIDEPKRAAEKEYDELKKEEHDYLVKSVSEGDK